MHTFEIEIIGNDPRERQTALLFAESSCRQFGMEILSFDRDSMLTVQGSLDETDSRLMRSFILDQYGCRVRFFLNGDQEEAEEVFPEFSSARISIAWPDMGKV